jgi:amidase
MTASRILEDLHMALERPNPDTLERLASQFGFVLTPESAEAFIELADVSLAAYELVDREWAGRAPITAARHWRRATADENPFGAWGAIADIREAQTGALAGKRVVIKNNVSVAGLPMADGSRLLEDYVADEDATVVRRILDAGGTIIGTAVCEDLCVSGASHTCATGPVSNPWNPAHSSGGSSSGCAVLVATGVADMAIGGDQGGSIRVPAAWSGLVGLKPTHGLVPYTGAFPIELTHDHLGPMAMTVTDVALLLSVIAGADGLDPRQITQPQPREFGDGIDGGVAGLRIGLLEEGFGREVGQSAVDDRVREAASTLAAAGAELVQVSIPEHREIAPAVWSVILTDGLVRQMLLGNGYGMNWRGRYSPSVIQAFAAARHTRFDDVSPAVQFAAVMGQYAAERFDGRHYAQAQNLALDLRAAYDEALRDVDLLCLPTSPMTATRTPAPDASIAEYIRSTFDMMENTAPFDTTGHPAISVPAGLVDGLPVGMMLVGKHFDESTILRAALSYENALGGFSHAPRPGER